MRIIMSMWETKEKRLNFSQGNRLTLKERIEEANGWADPINKNKKQKNQVISIPKIKGFKDMSTTKKEGIGKWRNHTKAKTKKIKVILRPRAGDHWMIFK